MSKLPRDVRAFAQRVKMAGPEYSLFIIVEGKGNDRAFYDRILAEYSKVTGLGYSIRLAEELAIEGKVAGGKSFAYRLFDHLEDIGSLGFENSSGRKSILFMLDRDYEHLAGTARVSDNIVYTEGSDVEGEIIRNGDIARAVGSAFSLDSALVRKVLARTTVRPAAHLADSWRQWIVLGVSATRHGIHSKIRFSQASIVNVEKYGALDEVAVAGLIPLFDGIDGRAGKEVVEECDAALAPIYDADRHDLLVSGKAVELFVADAVKTSLDGVPIQQVSSGILSKCCLETVDFKSPWVEHYTKRLELLRASGGTTAPAGPPSSSAAQAV